MARYLDVSMSEVLVGEPLSQRHQIRRLPKCDSTDVGHPFMRRSFRSATAEKGAWGDASVSLGLARRSVTVSGMSPIQAAWMRDRYGRSGSGPDAADVEIRVWRASEDLFVPYEEHHHPTSLRIDPEAGCVRLSGLFLCAKLYRSSTAPFRVSGADLWVPGGDRRSFDWALDNLLRVVAAYAAAASGGLLVHSAAILDRSGASVFFGRSNDGKTTLSQRFASLGFDVLGDDLHLLLPDERGGVTVEPMPYSGLYGRTRLRQDRHPLGSLHRLERASQARVRSLDVAETAGNLLACSPFVNGDPWCCERVIATATAWARRFPVDRVGLTLDVDPARLLGLAVS